MGRFQQPTGAKGSQRWLQFFVKTAPDVLEQAIGLGPSEWRSPLAADEYAEYGDEAFLARRGVTLTKRPLSTFWLRGGPQWDALGRAELGEVILVEAEA